jgi:ketol-acid reductoisomerase
MNSHPQPSNANAKSQSASGTRPRITIIGYGEGEGREHAKRLRDRGQDVRVAMLPGGMSWAHAVEDGFRPMGLRQACIDTDVLVLLVPPSEVELLYWDYVAPLARSGTLVLFAAAPPLHDDRFPKKLDVATIATNGDGFTLSVHANGTGHAPDRALAYIAALGGTVPRPPSSRMQAVDEADPFPHPSMRVL